MHTEEKLIINSEKGNLLKELISSIETCERFYISVAFINFSGLQLLLEALQEANRRDIEGRIITSTYLNFTDPKALERINTFPNIQLKVFLTDREIGFHTKAYIFEYKDHYKVIIGSSNITQSALKSNIEWNVEILSKHGSNFSMDVIKEYNDLWKRSSYADDHLIHEYSKMLEQIERTTFSRQFIYEKPEYIVPNSMQNRAIDNLDRLRALGEKKALVIAATGTGKTYMSAFDSKRFNPNKLLFIVHREEILTKAKETYERLNPNTKKTFGLFTGNRKEQHSHYVFATIQTLSRYFNQFEREEFDYIVIDEAHHATANTYQKVLQYFKPKFMLGMTATPERSDNHSIFELFDNNIGLEVRLHEALEDNIVIPFHYFGITDIDKIDLSDVNIDHIHEITKRLKVNERVDFVIEKMNFYGHDGEKRKCIGFCASNEHAQYMAKEFNKRGYKSIHLSGNDSIHSRNNYIMQLEDNDNELEFIFTVDIFNEGVDIPSINTILMLRPTNSPIVFIQQLGRGLRKHIEKDFLTVLDFIGNHNKAYLVAIALNGRRYYDKESLKVAISTGFANIPGATHIQMDKISQERILAQIDLENFASLKYLKDEYLEFKKLLSGRIPSILDYLKYDGAPDPTKFISYANSYLHFVGKVEKDEVTKTLLANTIFEDTIKSLSGMLPLKRVYEFVLLRHLLLHQSITTEMAKDEILKVIEDVDYDSILHAMENLNQDYFDSGQKKRNPLLVHFDGNQLTRSETFEHLLQQSEYRNHIKEVLDYGIFRYERDFKDTYYGIPHLKLYEQYKMAEIALLSNYRKTHSSFRGSGLLRNGNEYFLFIDLHKDKDIKESINYNDMFLSPSYFQWETPNGTSQATPSGQAIIYNKQKNVTLHLFIRKYKQIEKNKAEPYIYIGKGNTLEYEGNKPITVKLQLENTVPAKLYTEFTELV
ncbi:DUF3427 domain-containing protein [Pontibacillus salicampi]|uniref:DUF3427 domain-containing protein n=1 Tax=Pontibacillus salicampi TaxID=1449801 RepID=A0ABV6LQV2_9BACI